MKTPHKIAALAAALFVPLALTVPAANADQSYTGAIDGTEPTGIFFQPTATDGCGTTNPSPAFPYDEVTFVSQTDGPRRFVLRPTTGGGPQAQGLWVYRNDVCVGADYLADSPAEQASKVVDLDNVVIAKGDRVVVKIIDIGLTGWRLDILQPGTANAAAAGKGASYVKLPVQVSCVSHTATAQVAGKAKARKIKSITFTAGGKKVAAVKKVRARQNIKLKRIPATATSIKAVVKLKGGGKAKVVRAYSACS